MASSGSFAPLKIVSSPVPICASHKSICAKLRRNFPAATPPHAASHAEKNPRRRRRGLLFRNAFAGLRWSSRDDATPETTPAADAAGAGNEDEARLAGTGSKPDSVVVVFEQL